MSIKISNNYLKIIQGKTIKGLKQELKSLQEQISSSEDFIENCKLKVESIIKEIVFRKKGIELDKLYHLKTCGTQFRGCDPKCSKEIYENLIGEKNL